MTLQITETNLKTICTNAERRYPEECCGLLIGKINGEDNQVLEVWPADNSWNEADGKAFAEVSGSTSLGGTRQERYAIAPATLLYVQRQARDRGIQIIGVYHSHPDHPARPSEFDRAIAWAQYSYIIVSVHQGKVKDYYSWRLDENHQFQQEKILCTNTA